MSACDEGRWGVPRYIETETDELISVARCSDCGELLVVHRYRRVDVPDGADDRTIVAAVIAAIVERRRAA